MKPFFISVPHSGEEVPPETPWLHDLEETHLMCDVDRYVDKLYQPVIQDCQIPAVVARWHRYVADLNRLPEDVDEMSVEGASSSGKFSLGMGIHWAKTTQGDVLIKEPISMELHKKLIQLYHEPFHIKLREQYKELLTKHKNVYQLDAHSMPSKGTSMHRDPGEQRPEVVVSDCDGLSCSGEYKDLVIEAYTKAGFQVAYNWPYKGGRVTETYGHPDKGQHAIQVEMNRSIYMDETSKQWIDEKALEVQSKVKEAVKHIFDSL